MASPAYLRYFKRPIDVIVALAALLLVSPLLGAVAAAIWLRDGSPILFTQQRTGLHGASFMLLKFRTMTNAVGRDGRLLPDEERLTGFGRLLRRWSLDELPELFNVVRGEMSLVGPRPLPVRYDARYSRTQVRRLEAVPGITGVAQVRGRNNLSWDEKFAFDVWYVDHRGLLLDLSLLVATVGVVFKGTGISQPGHATMEEFMGSAQ